MHTTQSMTNDPSNPLVNRTICWIGGSRQQQPLDATQAKKWACVRQLGIRPVVIGFSTDARFRHFTQEAEFILLPALPSSILRYATIFFLGTLILLWLTLRRRAGVIVTQSPFDGAMGAFVKQAARLAGHRAALVIESHGDFEVAVFTQRQIAFASLYKRVMLAFAHYGLRHADTLRAVSSSTEAQLRQLAPHIPIHQFIGWTDMGTFSAVERALPPSQSHDLICPAVLIPRKSQHTLIEAFAALAPEQPQVHLWLVGKAENADYANRLHAQVEKLGLSERVHFTGAISQSALAERLGQCRALLLVSLSEGLPRVVIEAMLSGTPVIATAVSGTPDVIEDGVTGWLVPPEDVPALVKALRHLYAESAIDAIAQHAQVFARQRFSAETYAEGYRVVLTAAVAAVQR
ncbi:MAG: glycosyltransferase family 4 protein [Anaerolineae bacterium]|nr:glycosyltransferase family 4 protein [Anaerolineae bacterium]